MLAGNSETQITQSNNIFQILTKKRLLLEESEDDSKEGD